MKAVMKHKREHGGVDVFDIEKPAAPENDEVLVKIHSAALCGSDIHAYEFIDSYQSFMHVPVVLGHEGSGVVEAVGENVTGFKVGDRVMGESNIYCGTCRNCHSGMTHICDNNLMRGLTTPGVMREYVTWSEKNLHHVPANLSFPEAAAAQAVTVSAHGVLQRITVRPGDKVLVSGVGIIGLAAAQLARACGATVVMTGTDADEESRIPVAKSMGLDVFNCQKENVVEGFIGRAGSKADFTIECSGAAPAFISGLAAIRKGGSMLLLGLPNKEVTFPFANAIRSEINIITSYTSGWDDYEKTLALLSSGALDIKPLLTGYAVENAVRAFEDAVNKVAVKPVLQFAE
ncbi:MAG: alcohol dehydrogenase catalytic domain-containing protein [Deltaproteobacteria bacterium]|nr:alcohol dehydrogenase catalytic domain-containing protein [Deltaproteobacteria bacterium]